MGRYYVPSPPSFVPSDGISVLNFCPTRINIVCVHYRARLSIVCFSRTYQRVHCIDTSVQINATDRFLFIVHGFFFCFFFFAPDDAAIDNDAIFGSEKQPARKAKIHEKKKKN